MISAAAPPTAGAAIVVPVENPKPRLQRSPGSGPVIPSPGATRSIQGPVLDCADLRFSGVTAPTDSTWGRLPGIVAVAALSSPAGATTRAPADHAAPTA